MSWSAFDIHVRQSPGPPMVQRDFDAVDAASATSIRVPMDIIRCVPVIIHHVKHLRVGRLRNGTEIQLTT